MKGTKWIVLLISVVAVLGVLLICAAFGFFNREEDPYFSITGNTVADDFSSGDLLQTDSTMGSKENEQNSFDTVISTGDTEFGDLQPEVGEESTATEPTETEPTETEPTATEPTETEPTETEPTATEPTATEPTETEPTETEPTETEPTETEPTETEPTATEPYGDGDFSFEFGDLLG